MASPETGMVSIRERQYDLACVLVEVRDRCDRALKAHAYLPFSVVKDIAIKSLPLLTAAGLAAPHRLEEFIVGFGLFHSVQQKFDSCQVVHFVENLAQDPDLLQLLL